jgi:hypothetical protein
MGVVGHQPGISTAERPVDKSTAVVDGTVPGIRVILVPGSAVRNV